MFKITEGFKEKDFVTPKLPITHRVAEDQEEYQTLPCNIENGVVSFSFDVTEEDIKKIIENKKILVSLITFNHPIQPIRVSADPQTFEDEVIHDKEWVLEVLLSNEEVIAGSNSASADGANIKEKGEN